MDEVVAFREARRVHTVASLMKPLLALTATFCAFLLASAADAQGRRKLDVKPGPWNTRADVPEGWVCFDTAHYEIQSQAGREKGERLGKHMEAMYRVYRKSFDPRKPFTKKYVIKLLKSRAQFMAYGAPPGAGAYYSPVDREMVCYDTGKWIDEEVVATPTTGVRRPKGEKRTPEEIARAIMEKAEKERARYTMDILGAASHEGWHQYFHWYVVSWVEIPSWINEGMGDYFYTAKPTKVKGRAMPAELGRINELRLPVIQWAVRNDEHVPLETLVQMSKMEYYSNPSICYAQGWALCHFLLHSDNRRYQEVVPRFVKFVKDDTNMPVVTEKAFRGIDMKQLEEDWKAWLLAIPSPEDEETEEEETEEGEVEGGAAEKPASGESPTGESGV